MSLFFLEYWDIRTLRNAIVEKTSWDDLEETKGGVFGGTRKDIVQIREICEDLGKLKKPKTTADTMEEERIYMAVRLMRLHTLAKREFYRDKSAAAAENDLVLSDIISEIESWIGENGSLYGKLCRPSQRRDPNEFANEVCSAFEFVDGRITLDPKYKQEYREYLESLSSRKADGIDAAGVEQRCQGIKTKLSEFSFDSCNCEFDVDQMEPRLTLPNVSGLADMVEGLLEYTGLGGIIKAAKAFMEMKSARSLAQQLDPTRVDKRGLVYVTDPVNQVRGYAFKKVRRRYLTTIFRCILFAMEGVSRLITIISGGLAAIITEIIRLVAMGIRYVEKAYRNLKGGYKYVKGTKGVNRRANAQALIKMAAAQNQADKASELASNEAAKLIIEMFPPSTFALYQVPQTPETLRAKLRGSQGNKQNLQPIPAFKEWLEEQIFKKFSSQPSVG